MARHMAIRSAVWRDQLLDHEFIRLAGKTGAIATGSKLLQFLPPKCDTTKDVIVSVSTQEIVASMAVQLPLPDFLNASYFHEAACQ